ncbi:MAG: hypothetical protein KGL44_13605 [Sphingomonadales bacterium]|nr:hypothetical protein [Sphingomonadales bacterium]
MKYNGTTMAARVSLLTLGVMLAGCGGGGGSGGVASTPTPTPPPVTYTKIVDMSGNRTFQTAGVSFSPTGVGVTNGSARNFGDGTVVKYDAASDTYTLTAPTGETASFSPLTAQPTTVANAQQWNVPTGTGRETLTLFVPSSSTGVVLSYTIFGTWQTINNTGGSSTARLAVGGVPTVASDMPRTGTASYAAAIYGTAINNGIPYNLNASSKATFSTDFAAGTVATALDLAGKTSATAPVFTIGTYNGTGTIISGGPGFSGSLTGSNASGQFTGAFFGPSALEMGYTFFMNGSTLGVAGSVSGIKQ